MIHITLKSRDRLFIWSLFPTMGHVKSAWKNRLNSSWINVGQPVRGGLRDSRIPGQQAGFCLGAVPCVSPRVHKKDWRDMTPSMSSLSTFAGSSPNSLLFPISRRLSWPLKQRQRIASIPSNQSQSPVGISSQILLTSSSVLVNV